MDFDYATCAFVCVRACVHACIFACMYYSRSLYNGMAFNYGVGRAERRYISMRVCVCLCVRARVCVLMKVYVCVRACVHACMRACVRAYIHTYIHTHTQTHTPLKMPIKETGGEELLRCKHKHISATELIMTQRVSSLRCDVDKIYL